MENSRFPRHPALVTIGAFECHVLHFAFRSVREQFLAAWSHLPDPGVAERFGEGFRLALKEEFVPTPVWSALYLKLTFLGMEAIKDDSVLSCGHTADAHKACLKGIIGKLSSSRN